MSVTTKETTPGYCRNLYSFCMKAGPSYNFVYQVTEESFLDVVVGNNFIVANNALKNIYLFIHPFIHSFKYIFIRLLSVSFLIHLFDNLFTYLFNGVYIHLLSEVLQLRTEKKRFVTLSRQTNFICENEPMKTQRKYTWPGKIKRYSQDKSSWLRGFIDICRKFFREFQPQKCLAKEYELK